MTSKEMIPRVWCDCHPSSPLPPKTEGHPRVSPSASWKQGSSRQQNQMTKVRDDGDHRSVKDERDNGDIASHASQLSSCDWQWFMHGNILLPSSLSLTILIQSWSTLFPLELMSLGFMTSLMRNRHHSRRQMAIEHSRGREETEIGIRNQEENEIPVNNN